MNILVCLKLTAQSAYTDALGTDSNAERLSGGQLGINPADAYALELALRIKDADSTVHITAVTMAPQYAEHILRTALAMGADEAVHICDRALAGADTVATSDALSRAVRLLPAQELILCGKKAIDSETGHIGVQLAERLGIPAVTNAVSFTREGGAIRTVRAETDGMAEYLCPAPLVITVVNGSEPVRVPTIMGMRRSRNAVIQSFDAAALGLTAETAGQRASGTETLEVRQLRYARRHGERTDSAAEGAALIAALLRGGAEHE